LLGQDLPALVQVLQHAAAAGAEVRAARLHPVRRGLQHLEGAGLVEAAAAGGGFGQHRLAGQRAGDEHGLAVLAAGDATAVVAEVEDAGLEGGTVESGHGAGNGGNGTGGHCLRSPPPSAPAFRAHVAPALGSAKMLPPTGNRPWRPAAWNRETRLVRPASSWWRTMRSPRPTCARWSRHCRRRWTPPRPARRRCNRPPGAATTCG